MKPQAPTIAQMRSEMQKAASGPKKVLGPDGKPLVVYHGTNQDIKQFSPERLGENTRQRSAIAFYLTEHPQEAAEYADMAARRQVPNAVEHEKRVAKLLADAQRAEKRGDWDAAERLYGELEEVDLGAINDDPSGHNIIPAHIIADKIKTIDMNHSFDADLLADEIKKAKAKGLHALKLENVYDPVGDRPQGFSTTQWVVFDPNRIKSAISAPDTPDITTPDLTKAKGGEVKQPSLDAMRLALNKQGMYSPLEKAAMSIPRTKGTPAEFMAEISKQPGFRKEEVEDRKISLPEQKMSKQEFLGHLKNHPSPLLDEKVLKDVDEDEIRDQIANEHYGTDYLGLGYNSGKHVDKMVEEAMKNSTAYGNWQLPGGENYREVLLKLPQQGLSDKERDRKMWLEANQRRGSLTIPEDNELMKLQIKEKRGSQDYHSSHWQDDPNVLAHMRLSDRTGPNGEKILHVEEVQSDWHQQGRKQGYYTPEQRQELKDAMRKWKAGREGALFNGPDQFAKENPEYAWMNHAAPDAPFKKNWHELALKHALSMAAKGGYHGIAITPGEQQAERYDLSKHIDLIRYEPETQNFFAKDKNGQVVHRGHVPPEELPNYVGKDMADKIAAGGEFSGLDIKTGGEGMKGFYDKIVPTFLNKLGKPHGAQVQMHSVPVSKKNVTADEVIQTFPGGVADAMRSGDVGAQQYIAQRMAEANKPDMLHYFPITDSMRQQITQEGLPQYDHGGGVHPLIPEFED